jgi:hypothetical protein
MLLKAVDHHRPINPVPASHSGQRWSSQRRSLISLPKRCCMLSSVLQHFSDVSWSFKQRSQVHSERGFKLFR